MTSIHCMVSEVVPWGEAKRPLNQDDCKARAKVVMQVHAGHIATTVGIFGALMCGFWCKRTLQNDPQRCIWGVARMNMAGTAIAQSLARSFARSPARTMSVAPIAVAIMPLFPGMAKWAESSGPFFLLDRLAGAQFSVCRLVVCLDGQPGL